MKLNFASNSGRGFVCHSILWFGKKAIDINEFGQTVTIEPKKYSFTFAIRLYEKARSKGLANKFMQAVFADFGQKGIWLETGKDN